MPMTTRQFSLDNKFRMEIAKRLMDDPHQIIPVEDVIQLAIPLFGSASGRVCTLMFARLKWFLRGSSLTAMTINASTEFPRFGIIKAASSGSCNPQSLKAFLNRHNLIFTSRFDDRVHAVTAADELDRSIEAQLGQEFSSTTDAVINTNRYHTNMIFVSPYTLMAVIERVNTKAEECTCFKRHVAHLRMLLIVVQEERSKALAMHYVDQQAQITALTSQCDSLAVQLNELAITAQETGQLVERLNCVLKRQTLMLQQQYDMDFRFRQFLESQRIVDDEIAHTMGLSRCRVVLLCIWIDPFTHRAIIQVGHDNLANTLDSVHRFVTDVHAAGADIHAIQMIAVCDVDIACKLPIIIDSVYHKIGIANIDLAHFTGIPWTMNDLVIDTSIDDVERVTQQLVTDLQADFISRQLFGIRGLLESNLLLVPSHSVES